MDSTRWRLAVAASLGVVSTVVYVVVRASQGDGPLPWYLALLVGGVVLITAAIGSTARWRSLAGGGLLMVAGLLGLMSIGLPAFLGGLIALVTTLSDPRRTRAAAPSR